MNAVVAMSEKMFYSIRVSVSLWFIDMNKKFADERNRKRKTLFIDPR
ncbi:N-6 DNA methylase [Leuconostoc pseudomesenteroides]